MRSIETTVWGKFDEATGVHHLAHHCADVAACFLALAALPVWRDRMEKAAERPISPSQLERLAVLVFDMNGKTDKIKKLIGVEDQVK